MTVFYVSKFDWMSSGPMSTVSTMFTFAISCQGIKTFYITRCSSRCNPESTLESRFGIKQNGLLSIHIFRKINLLNSSILFYLQALLFILCKASNKDIIYTRNSTFLPYLFLIKLFTGAKAFFEAHGYHGKFIAFKRVTLSRYSIVETIFLRKLDGVISLTDAMKNLFKTDYPYLPIKTLPLGSSPVAIHFKINPAKAFSSRQLCYIGRYNQNIDAQSIFKAIYLCKSLDIKLIWIGTTPEQKHSLLQLAEQNQIQSQIELLPWMGYKDMCVEVHNKASAGLVAYIDSYDSNIQISPTKLFDFFSFGIPVVGSKVGAVKEIIRDELSGILYNPGDPIDLSNKIRLLFSDYHIYNRYCRISYELASEYTWENRAKKFLVFAENTVTAVQ